MAAVVLATAAPTFAQFNGFASPTPLPVPTTAMRDVSDVLAYAGKHEFKLEDIRPYLAKLDDQQKAALVKEPETLTKFVRTFLTQRLLLDEALAAKWDQKPDVAVQLNRVRENAIADSYLESVSVIPSDFPGEEELRAAYDANKAQFVSPRQLHLAQMMIEGGADGDQRAKDMAQARLEMVRKALKDPKADFLGLAQAKATETGNAVRGGDVGWVPEAKVPAPLRDAALKLTPGAVSEAIPISGGWVILKLVEVREAAQIPFEQVRPFLVQRLRAARTRQASETYVHNLLEKNSITINDAALSQLLAPASK